MILDPRAILHLALVEYRWLALLYFTFFTIIVSATISITLHAESEEVVDLIRCTGVATFNSLMAEGVITLVLHGADEYKLEVASCDPQGPCREKVCGDSSFSRSDLGSCDCRVTFRDRDLQAYYVNVLMIVVVLVPYGVLIVYCIVFKSGKFNGLAAGQKYIESCQSVQNSAVFRTYCNILAFVCVAVIGYGIYEAQIGTGDGDRGDGDQQATQNLIVAGLAVVGLIRAPHRYGSTAGDYDLKIIRKHRNGWLTKIVRLLMWDSTRYYEEYMRASKYDKRSVDADGNTIENPSFEASEGDERKGVPDDIATTAFALTSMNAGYCECVPGCI